MKKVLFIVNQGLISLNANGGASVYYSHLELLYLAGYKVHLLAVQWSDKDTFKKSDYIEIHKYVSTIDTYIIESKAPKKSLKRAYHAIFSPEKFEYYFLNKKNKKFLQEYTKIHAIDLIFADWRWAAIWAGFSKVSVPVVYGHHDWEYKLARLRTKRTFLQKFHTFQKKRVEFALVKKVAGVISGSKTETEEVEKISRKKALYLPTTYANVKSNLKPLKQPNIVHLGGMGTTANRLGLERFLDVCWPKIHQDNPHINLIIIGSLKEASPVLLKKIGANNIICKGFIFDLSEVLHPNDIHIIPWEYNTGTRTRIPVVFNHSQALVATKASVAAFPEILHKQNAILCDNLESMIAEITALITNYKQREFLSNNGKKTFLASFTSIHQTEKMKKYLDSLFL